MESISLLIDSPSFVKAATLAIALVAIATYWIRTGSINSLLERLWRMAVDKDDANDARLKEFMQEARDLEKFRFIYGIKVKSMGKLHRFLNWQKENNIGIEQSQKIRQWIDTEAEEMLICPPHNYLWKKYAYLVASLLLIVGASLLANYSSVLLSLKTTKTLVTAEHTKVSGTVSDWAISREDCESASKTIQAPQGLGAEERKIICKLLTDDSYAAFIDKTVKEQKQIGLMFCIIGICLFIYFGRKFTAAVEARRLKKRLEAAETELES